MLWSGWSSTPTTRELWIPYEKLGREGRRHRQRETSAAARREGAPFLWLLETDADLLFHTPFFRAVSLVVEDERLPVREPGHVLAVLWKRAEREEPGEFRTALDRARLRHGVDVFEGVPEAASGMVARHIMAQPWTYWRYPRGAATPGESTLYGRRPPEDLPLAADPRLQVKRPTDAPAGPG